MRNSVTRFSRFLWVSLWFRLFLTSAVFALPADSVNTKRVGLQVKKVARTYKFVRYAENKLFTPDSLAMRSFYLALDSLRAGKKQKVNVVHLGDSHIQADIFSG